MYVMVDQEIMNTLVYLLLKQDTISSSQKI